MESDKKNQFNNGNAENLNTANKLEDHENEQNEWHDHTDTDKYLALEQDGVTFTNESHPTNYSDRAENGEQGSDTWDPNGENSRNSEAFNQDDYILNDNIDLDEDQNQSISSEET